MELSPHRAHGMVVIFLVHVVAMTVHELPACKALLGDPFVAATTFTLRRFLLV